MAVNKSFVIKNGLEVNTNLILANPISNSVGIGTSVTNHKLHVNGGIGATDITVTGFGTVTNIFGDIINYNNASFNVGVVTTLSGSTLNYSGIATVGSLNIGADEVISSAKQLKNIASLDSTTTATIEAAIANAPNTFTNLVVTGVSTLGVTGITTLSVTDTSTLGVTGITTLNVSGISTLGTVEISSGIVTATSGVVTYYGDGTNLSLTGNPDLLSSTGIGIGTTGGLVGYGITFVNFYGAGVSTSLYDASVGIATIFFEGGGGGGGAIGIGSTFPGTLLSLDPEPSNGDLFFHIDYGRTFIYYDEVVLGVGSSAFWIDSSPFNIGIISLDNLTVGDLIVTNSASITGLAVTNLSVTNINASGIITAFDFDSTSDQSLKTNIQTVDHALDIVSDLRGVSFDWKQTGKPSYGVIAQELEQVIPELVGNGDIKTVNYNGIIGVLIEAIKELKNEIQDLKSINN